MELWASTAGRALQTLAIIAEHLELDWHEARTDARLAEIDVGLWGGRLYADLELELGGFIDASAGIFSRRPPEGEWYDDVARRLAAWLAGLPQGGPPRLVVMHGMSSRVLRGMLTGREPLAQCGAPLAPTLPQGSVVRIENGVEGLVHRGRGGQGVSKAALA